MQQVTSDSSYKEWEQMRITLEPLAYKYGVDLFYNGALLIRFTAHACMRAVSRQLSASPVHAAAGHVHSYERSNPGASLK
jgi:hypothetical protein